VPKAVALSGVPQRASTWSIMNERLESGSCSRVGMRESIGVLLPNGRQKRGNEDSMVSR
jgi:hypothetical protein